MPGCASAASACSRAPRTGPITARLTGLGDGRVVDPDARPAGGESVRDLYRRAAGFLRRARGSRRHARMTGRPGTCVVVAHGGTLRVLTAYLHGVAVDADDLGAGRQRTAS